MCVCVCQNVHPFEGFFEAAKDSMMASLASWVPRIPVTSLVKLDLPLQAGEKKKWGMGNCEVWEECMQYGGTMGTHNLHF